jgi:myosin heavy subunit
VSGVSQTRLSRPPPGERNFHVLHQLLAPAEPPPTEGRPPSLLEVLPIGAPEQMYYLGADQPWSAAEAAAETAAFARTTASLDALGIGGEERTHLWTLLSAVLLLGNLRFAPVRREGAGVLSPGSGGGGFEPDDAETHETLARLLGVTPAALAAALCKRKLSVRQQHIHRPVSASAACDARDALGRALYNGCFEQLVHTLNATICPHNTATDAAGALPHACVGILDIYGFECLESNSFEQLLIN